MRVVAVVKGFLSFVIATAAGILAPLEVSAQAAKTVVAAPRSVVIPDDIPSMEIIENWKTGEKRRIFPRALYEKAFLTSWNECLLRYGYLNCSINECSSLGLASPLTLEPYSGRGIADGIAGSVKRLAECSDAIGNYQSGENARKAFVEMKTPQFVFFPGRESFANYKEIEERLYSKNGELNVLRWKLWDGGPIDKDTTSKRPMADEKKGKNQ